MHRSDGISDNFDPVVGKFCVPRKPERTGGGPGRSSSNPRSSSQDFLPVVEPLQRHELTLARIEDILNQGSGTTVLYSTVLRVLLIIGPGRT